MIKIRNLNKTYFGASPLHVLKGINLDVDKGEFISIMGSSGSGKSTLLNILGILDNYETGEYFLDNVFIKNLSETKAAAVRNEKIGFIFQSFNLISFKNAMENVALPLYYQGVSRKKRNMLALEYLDKMGLKSHAEHLPNEMSGGQKQRVAIARALIAQPQIILADEPTGALDSKTSEDVMHILRDLNTVDGITMIIVTHEQAVANATDRIVHIKDGIISSIEDRKEIHLKNKSEVLKTNISQKPVITLDKEYSEAPPEVLLSSFVEIDKSDETTDLIKEIQESKDKIETDKTENIQKEFIQPCVQTIENPYLTSSNYNDDSIKEPTSDQEAEDIKLEITEKNQKEDPSIVVNEDHKTEKEFIKSKSQTKDNNSLIGLENSEEQTSTTLSKQTINLSKQEIVKKDGSQIETASEKTTKDKEVIDVKTDKKPDSNRRWQYI